MTRVKRGARAGPGPWRPGGLGCEEVRAAAWAWLAGDLPAARSARVRRHLAACPHCFSRVEFARVLRNVTRRRFTGARAPRSLARGVRGLAARGVWKA